MKQVRGDNRRRFMAKVRREGEHWIWKRRISATRAQFRMDDGRRMAPRHAAWEIFGRPLADGEKENHAMNAMEIAREVVKQVNKIERIKRDLAEAEKALAALIGGNAQQPKRQKAKAKPLKPGLLENAIRAAAKRGPIRVADVLARFPHLVQGSVSMALVRLSNEGALERIAPGLYRIPAPAITHHDDRRSGNGAIEINDGMPEV